MNIAIILAGGSGERFGGKVPKQFMSLNGKPIVQYVINAINDSGVIDEIILVGNSKFWDKVNVRGYEIPGGKTRSLSVRKGIEAAKKFKPTNVIFFDAVRPLVTPDHIRKIIDLLSNGEKAVITTNKINDALIMENNGYLKKSLEREYYKITQTPDGFNWKELLKNYKKPVKDGTTSSNLVSCKVKCLDLNTPNLKITYKKDLFIAEQLVKYKDIIRRFPNVRNKTILLLGRSGGIGSEVLKQLKLLGADVTAPTHRELDIKYIEKSEYLKKEWDCIINCAGVNYKDIDLTKEKFNNLVNINLWPNLAILLYAKAKNIVLIGSTSASFGREGIVAYSALKSALNSLVEGYSNQLLSRGSNVNVVCPANIATKMQTYLHSDINLKKLMQPKDIAKIIIGYCDVGFTGNIVFIKEGQE